MFVAANAFADGGLMNDLTLENSCNVSYLGAYGGNVIMVPQFELATFVCSPGYYLPKNSETCTLCENDNYCVGGAYTFDTVKDQGESSCPQQLFSPSGMSSADQCGHKLHIGDDVVYLRAVKKTTPSLNVQYGADIFYGNMTVADIPMNNQTERKLKIGSGSTIYSVYDDSIEVDVPNQD